MGSFSIWHWLIVLVIVVLVFGTKRLKNVGKDLGEAVKGFKQGVHDDEAANRQPAERLADARRSEGVEPGQAERPVAPVAPVVTDVTDGQDRGAAPDERK